jgi:hypothetical protein
LPAYGYLAWGSGAIVAMKPNDRPSDDGSALVFERPIKRAVGNAVIRRFRADADSSAFEGLAGFHAIWRSKLREGGLPRWTDFDFRDFTGWHRHVALGDITPDDADPVFRIFGSEAVDLLGRDLTGKKLSLSVPAVVTDGILEHFEHIRDERLIGTVTGKIGMEGREFLDFQVIEMPLENAAGEVSQILFGYLSLRHGRLS